MFCTLDEFQEALDFNKYDLVADEVYGVEDLKSEADKITDDVTFYYTREYCCSASLVSNKSYVFMQSNFEARAATLLSQNKSKININWVLLDSQSTVDI